MRFRNLFAVCLATDVALASVCKPRPSASSSVMTAESATSTISATAPTTTVQTESTTATSADLSTTLTSTVDDETTAEATETATTIETSVTVGLSTTGIETTGTTETATTDTTTTDAATTDETTTTAVATSAETTTADATTTTADNFDPIPTFNVLAIGAQVDGQKLSGEVEPGYGMGWNLPGAPQILAFSIEPDTNQVREIGGNYLCVRYADGDIHFLTLCDPGTETNFMGGVARVTCEQTRDQRLECSAPAGQCMLDPLTGITICSAMLGTFTGFYAYSGGTTGVTLAMGREDIAPTTDTQSVDLGIEPASDDT
ncbi:cytochrome P450 monooxygenase [Fusarium circinatum]|uniref:Cytochrome P450 monooxygenase n=1 Tax=Fusarium circinatum TaxID=48490 RepID=A0A8H5X2A5_FUSCI|nr:cytochrome P450 monooxygenase [Fusarium circinatum]